LTQSAGFVCALDHFLLDGQSQRQRLWGYTLDEHLSNCLIKVRSRNPLTGSQSLLNTFVGTEVIRHDAFSSPLVVAHRHALSAFAAEDETDVKSAGPSRGGEKRSGA
jgi:hypothetical protein